MRWLFLGVIICFGYSCGHCLEIVGKRNWRDLLLGRKTSILRVDINEIRVFVISFFIHAFFFFFLLSSFFFISFFFFIIIIERGMQWMGSHVKITQRILYFECKSHLRHVVCIEQRDWTCVLGFCLKLLLEQKNKKTCFCLTVLFSSITIWLYWPLDINGRKFKHFWSKSA